MSTKYLTMKILVTLFALGVLAGAAAALELPNGRDLLRKAIENEPKARYSGVYVTQIRRSDESPTEARILIKRNATKGFRIEFQKQSGAARGIIVDNGEQFQEILPGNQQVRTGSSRARLPLMLLFPGRQNRFFGNLDRLSVRTVRHERIVGRDAWVIEMTLPRTNAPRRRLWIDAVRWVPLRSEVVGPTGNVIFRSGFQKIDFSPSFGAEDFVLRRSERGGLRGGTPMSLAEVRAAAGFQIALPKYLPPEFKLEEAALVRWRGKNIVRLRYGNGFAAFTLFESQRARPPRNLPRRVQSKTVDGVYITMVSNNLKPEEQDRIFASVR